MTETTFDELEHASQALYAILSIRSTRYGQRAGTRNGK